MYEAPFTATLQDFASKPVDEHHERQRVLLLKLQGVIEPELFDDVDNEVKRLAERINESAVSTVAFPIHRNCTMAITAGIEQEGVKQRSREFESVELLTMRFSAPKGKAKRGTWSLTLSLSWEKPDLVFVADTHRLRGEVTLVKLADKPEAQLTIDDAIEGAEVAGTIGDFAQTGPVDHE